MKSNTYAHAIRTLRTWKKKQIIIVERESNIKEEEEEAKKLPNDSVSSPKSRVMLFLFWILLQVIFKQNIDTQVRTSDRVIVSLCQSGLIINFFFEFITILFNFV